MISAMTICLRGPTQGLGVAFPSCTEIGRFRQRRGSNAEIDGTRQIGKTWLDWAAQVGANQSGRRRMGIIWTIIIGFVAGLIAKFLHPGDNEPKGFILTTILGIVGALLATYIGQAIGWYKAGEGAGLIGAVVGAIVILLVWGIVTKRTA
jgi:uncharacterized membrane protein YeaQ/YmgE (transglycosylase-associated protein family)